MLSKSCLSPLGSNQLDHLVTTDNNEQTIASTEPQKILNQTQKQETKQETYNMPAKLVNCTPVQTRKRT